MLNKLYLKRYFWIYATLFFSLTFYLLDESFIFGLSFFQEKYHLMIHRTALFIIVVAFITWTQYALGRIITMNNQMLQTAKLTILGEMSASIAHEIIRPLANIDLQVQINLRKNDKSAEFIELNLFVQKHLEKCTALVNSLRMFGRNSTSSPKSSNDINAIITESLNLTRSYISFTAVNKELTDNLPPTMCNALQLEQVLANLMVNAKDALASSKEGIITIRSFIKNGCIIIEVEDNGGGISKASIKKIFDPFYTTKEEGKGTGLGLAISFRIINDHGGKLDVKSQPGKTTFRLSLAAIQ